MKEVLTAILNENNIQNIQRIVRNYAFVRQQKFQETVGEIYSIVPLFSEFDEIKKFLIPLEDSKVYLYGYNEIKSFNLGPVLSITVDNLINSAGNLGKASQYNPSNYSTSCIRCKKLL